MSTAHVLILLHSPGHSVQVKVTRKVSVHRTIGSITTLTWSQCPGKGHPQGQRPQHKLFLLKQSSGHDIQVSIIIKSNVHSIPVDLFIWPRCPGKDHSKASVHSTSASMTSLTWPRCPGRCHHHAECRQCTPFSVATRC